MRTNVRHSLHWEEPPVADRTEQDIRYSYWEAACFSFMVGIGETYLGALLLASGSGPVKAGLIVALPLLVGALAQIMVQRISARTTSRLWVIRCAFVQALVFIPLSLMSLKGSLPFGIVFALVSIYWAAGMSAVSHWTYWIEGLISSDRRSMFLAVRSRIAQIAVFAGFLTGGVILQLGRETHNEMAAFAVVFALAGLVRFVSLSFLKRQSESPAGGSTRMFYSFAEFRERCRDSTLRRFFRFLLLMHGAVYVAAPFFTPYMFRELRLSYATYVLLIAAAYLSKAAAFPACGRLCRRFGPRRVLVASGILIVPLSGLWMFSAKLSFLLFIQLTGAIAWAAYELATVLLLFEIVRQEERSTVLGYYNLFQAAMVAGGSLAGAGMLYYFASGPQAYWLVFGASSLFRALAIALLFNVSDVKLRKFRLRPLGVSPMDGTNGAPVLVGKVRQTD